MAINNYICVNCDKSPVCKVMGVLKRFHEDNKISLGVNITIDKCYNYAPDDESEEDEQSGS